MPDEVRLFVDEPEPAEVSDAELVEPNDATPEPLAGIVQFHRTFAGDLTPVVDLLDLRQAPLIVDDDPDA